MREPTTLDVQATPHAPVVTPASPSAPSAQNVDHDGDGIIAVGSEVTVSGLVNAPQYNGMSGRVEAQQGDRWAVELHSNGSRLALRPANLVLSSAAPAPRHANGAILSDLVTASAPIPFNAIPASAVLPLVIAAATSSAPASATTPAPAATLSAPVLTGKPPTSASAKVGAGVDAIDGLRLLVAGLPVQIQAAAAKWCMEKEWDSVALLAEAKIDDEFIAALNVKLDGGRGVILRKRLAELRASLAGQGARKHADWMGGAQSREG